MYTGTKGGNSMIPISKPMISAEDIKAVTRVLKSGMIAAGPAVKKFEEKFASYTGVKQAVAVSNGTAALHAALYGIGVRKGDRVVVPSFTFIASANAVLQAGGVPVFADIRENTMNMDPDKLEEILMKDDKGRIKAVMPVHLYGRVCEMDKIMKIARKHGAMIIEDAAQAHGAKYRGKMAGSFGDAAGFSMYATKNMTTGEGGMVTTNTKEASKIIRSFINHGSEGVYHHTREGYNYRMTDAEAAMGITQLKRLDYFNRRRRKNAARYGKILNKYGWLILPDAEKDEYHVYHQYTVRVKRGLRDRLASFLRENGIGAKVFYPVPVHMQPLYKKSGIKKAKLPVAEKAAAEVLSLPAHPGLTPLDFIKIESVFRKFNGRI